MAKKIEIGTREREKKREKRERETKIYWLKETDNGQGQEVKETESGEGQEVKDTDSTRYLDRIICRKETGFIKFKWSEAGK